MLTFSVIICTYNRCDLLKESLVSILSIMPDNGKYELIVIDNNSTDNTKETVRNFTNVRYVLEANQGLSYARNRAIKESQNTILLFLDDDIELNSNYFEICKALYSESDCNIVGGKVLPYKVQIPHWLAPEFYYLSSVFDLGNQPMDVSKVMGANYTMRKSVAVEVGGYNINLGRKGKNLAGGEEVEYLNRAKSKGYKINYEPNLVVYHKINEKLEQEYILSYAFQHGQSEVLVDLGTSKLRFSLKIVKALLVTAMTKMRIYRYSDLQKDMSAQIKSKYFSGYIKSALLIGHKF